ncbi:MAG: hypothetical protein VW683_00490 [Betaproteobacteria bacterium]
MSNQRRVMAMVRAVQRGVVPENEVSPNIKFLARNLTIEQIYELMRDPNGLQEYLEDFIPQANADRKEKRLRELSDSDGVKNINGTDLDRFSAHIMLSVLDRLSPHQKRMILNLPVEEAMAISYKLASRANEEAIDEKKKTGG